MNDTKKKLTFSGMTPADVAALFRELADHLDGAPLPETTRIPMPIQAFRKCKIGIKQELDGYTVKLKMKLLSPETAGEAGEPAADTEETDDTLPKYKHLKKKMKQSFKAITESLAANTLPPEAVVTEFLQDSLWMIAYPGYGDEYYNAYEAACRDFRNAFESKDMDACRTTCGELNRLKKECHDRYK